MKKIYDIIELPKNFDPRGSLTVVEENITIPFDIKSISWKYKMKNHEEFPVATDANHHKLFVALHGSFHVILVDNGMKRAYLLDNPHQGLILYPDSKVSIKTRQEGSVLLELSSK